MTTIYKYAGATVMALALAGCGGSTSEDAGSDTPSADKSTKSSAAGKPTKSAPSTGLADGSFTATKPTLKDQYGTCMGTARVTNTGDDEKSGTFTFTALKDGETAGALQGVANEVGPGKTATVQLVSTDACPKGSVTYEFQVDAEF